MTKVYIECSENCESVSESLITLIEQTAKMCIQIQNIELDCGLDVTLTDDIGIRAINNETRSIDGSTDVLSFPLVQMTDGNFSDVEGDFDLDENILMLGDLVISFQTAKRQAAEYGHSINRELAFLVSHGMFHLLGYDHQDEDSEKKMLNKQEAVLIRMGLTRE